MEYTFSLLLLKLSFEHASFPSGYGLQLFVLLQTGVQLIYAC